jgi:hypothetical protein
VGFEPTVGFPTLDFESSALNRTQPPFRDEKKNVEPAYAKSFGVASAELPKSNVNATVIRNRNVAQTILSATRPLARAHSLVTVLARRVAKSRATRAGSADTIVCLTGQKMLQFYTCHVRQTYCILYVHTDSHAITCC